MNGRVFSDERIREILSSLNWGRLYHKVYDWCHSERFDHNWELTFFMYAGNLTIELWGWDYVTIEWIKYSEYNIPNISSLSNKLENGVRRCLERAMY